MIAAPPVALTVSPTRVVLLAGAPERIEVTNLGTSSATVTASVAGLAVGLRGTPRVAGGRPAPAVVVRPRRFALSPGATAAVLVSFAHVRAAAGDRPALVLFSSLRARGGVAVGLRVGVVVLVRGTGRAVHRLVPLALRAHGRELELALRNDGNVSERLSPETVRVRLLPHGRAEPEPRELLPHTRGLLTLRTRAREPTGAVVRVLGRTFRLQVAGRR